MTLSALACGEAPTTTNLDRPPHLELSDGSAAPPASGQNFISTNIAISSRVGADNALGPLGRVLNDQLRQGLLGGETLLLLEVAGLDPPFYGNDEAAELRVYGGFDFDEPFFPANNFQRLKGVDTCCQFLIAAESMSADRRSALTRLPIQADASVVSARAPGRMHFPLTVGVPPHPVFELERFGVNLSLGTEPAANRPDKGTLKGSLFGVWSYRNLASIENPFCRTANGLCSLPGATLLDMVEQLVAPAPTDLDGDGLERVERDGAGRVIGCVDGDGSAVPGTPGRPEDCVLDPRMADGYSIVFDVELVGATIEGIGF